MFRKSQVQPSQGTQNTSTSNIKSKQNASQAVSSPAVNLHANIMQKNVQKIQELEKEIEELKRNYNHLEKQSSDAQDKLCRERDELRAQNVRLQNQFDVLQAEFNTIQSKSEKEKAQKAVVSKQAHQEMEIKLRKIQEEYDQAARDLNEQKRVNFDLAQDIQQLRAMLEDARAENDQLHIQIEEMQHEISTYEGKQMESNKKQNTRAKAVTFDDDEPEVFSLTNQQKQRSEHEVKKPQRSQSTPYQNIDRGKITFAFREAEKTINELQDQIKQQKTEVANLKKQLDAERAERRLENEDLVKQLEEKNTQYDELLAQVQQLNIMEINEQAFNQIEYKIEKESIKLNKSELSKPMPVYHSLVNPSSLHNARKEYSLVKNENIILREENKILQEKLKKYEEIGVENMHLQQKMRQMIDINVEQGNQTAITNSMLAQHGEKLQEKFNNDALESELQQAKKISADTTQQSFFNNVREKALLQKSKLAGEPSILVDNAGDQAGIAHNQNNKQIVADYVMDATIEELRLDYKNACEQIEKYEAELVRLRGAEQQVIILKNAVNQLQEDNAGLKQLMDDRERQSRGLIHELTAVEAPKPAMPASPVLRSEKRIKPRPQSIEKGVQWGVSVAIPMISRETQTLDLFDGVGRARPMLVGDDGSQYIMGTNQMFTAMNGSNAGGENYRIVQNMIVDERDNRVNFSGTYKDNRGVFNVVRGMIDINSQRSIDDFSSRQNYGEVYRQLQVYKQEIDRVEAENRQMAEQLYTLRCKLATVQGTSVDEVVSSGAAGDGRSSWPGKRAMAWTNQSGVGEHEPCLGGAEERADTLAQRGRHLNIQLGGRGSDRAINCATSPTVPEEHLETLVAETEKEAQTDLYVVPLDTYQLEKEKSSQYCKQNSQLQIQLRQLNRVQKELDQKQTEFKAAVQHISELNNQLTATENQNLALKQQSVQLQSQVEILLKNKDSYSDIFLQTNQAQQEMFDNLRQRLGQKDAQIQDLQGLLKSQRESSLRQIQQLTEEINKLRQFGDDFNQLQVNNIKQELINQENQLVNQINQNQFRQKLIDFGGANSSVEQQLRQAARENRQLKKAGEMIKDAFLREQNKSYAVQQVSQRYKNGLAVLFQHHGWPDLEIYINNDDQALTLENQILARLGGGPVAERIGARPPPPAGDAEMERLGEGSGGVGYGVSGRPAGAV